MKNYLSRQAEQHKQMPAPSPKNDVIKQKLKKNDANLDRVLYSMIRDGDLTSIKPHKKSKSPFRKTQLIWFAIILFSKPWSGKAKLRENSLPPIAIVEVSWLRTREMTRTISTYPTASVKGKFIITANIVRSRKIGSSKFDIIWRNRKI